MNQTTFYIVLSVIVFTIILGFVISFVLEINKDKNEKNVDSISLQQANKCPDYWEVRENNVCHNTHGVGLCKNGGDRDMNFEDDLFKGSSGDNYKCAWAKQCQVPWEGIDNLC
jgi:hypothetical protein